MSNKRDLATVLLGVSVAVILWCTLLNREATETMAYSLPFHTFFDFTRNVQRGFRGNMLGNILLFIPYGFFLPVVWKKKLWKIIGAGAALSIHIEIAQLLTHRGMCDLDDVLFNSIGAGFGYVFFSIIHILLG